MEQQTIKSFDHRMVLIVDEAPQFMDHEGRVSRSGAKSLEFIREIHDIS